MQRLDELRRESGAVKPLMHLFFAVNRNNMHELASAMELAERTGCDGITYGRFVELGDEVAGLVLVKSERMQLARQLRTLAKELNRRSLTNTIKRDVVMQESGPETWRLAPCMIGWFHARIRGNGDVVPCCRCSYPLGNLYEKTFSEIWQGDRMMEFRRRVAAPDGMGWLKSQNAQCHDCPHIPEMIKLYRIQRMLKWTQRRRETATG